MKDVGEGRRPNANDRVCIIIKEYGSPKNLRIPPKIALPALIAENRDVGSARPGIPGSDRPAKSHGHGDGLEEAAGNKHRPHQVDGRRVSSIDSQKRVPSGTPTIGRDVLERLSLIPVFPELTNCRLLER